MDKLSIYVIVTVIAVAGATAVLGLASNGMLNHIVPTIPTNENKANTKTVNALVVKPLEIKIKSITANKTNANTAILRLALDVHNPNQDTVLLDGLHYNITSDNLPIKSGDIGTETQLDVVRGQSAFHIIGDSTITLKDTGILHRNNIVNATWDKIVSGKATYVIKGSYYSKQTANFDYSPGSNDFKSTYP